MGTRGFVGFVLDEVEKIFVTHSDSYPSASGVEVLRWVTANLDGLLLPEPDGVLDRIRALRVIAGEDEPNLGDDLERIRRILIERDSHDDPDYYAQASPEELLEFVTYDLDTTLLAGVVVDGSDFPGDSLACEWGYLVDLDRSMFEVYRGLQATAPTTGRFARRTSAGGHPVALVASWHLVQLPDRDGFMAFPDAY